MATQTVQLPGMSSSSKSLNVGLWVAQFFLATCFGIAGFLKLTAPYSELVNQMGWPAATGEMLTRFIGGAEATGAVGLLLPSITRVKPKTTALAAIGLFGIMLFAFAFHISRGEVQMLPITVLLGSIAAFIAWGRGVRRPIEPR